MIWYQWQYCIECLLFINLVMVLPASRLCLPTLTILILYFLLILGYQSYRIYCKCVFHLLGTCMSIWQDEVIHIIKSVFMEEALHGRAGLIHQLSNPCCWKNNKIVSKCCSICDRLLYEFMKEKYRYKWNCNVYFESPFLPKKKFICWHDNKSPPMWNSPFFELIKQFN